MAANPLLKCVVEPQPVMAISSPNREERMVAEHQIVVYAAVGEGFESYSFGGADSGLEGGGGRCERGSRVGGRGDGRGRGLVRWGEEGG